MHILRLETQALRSLRFAGAVLAALCLAVALNGCNKSDRAGSGSASSERDSGTTLTVLAGSELRDIEPSLVGAAREAGIELKLTYAGTLDIVERINSGEKFDAILPPSGAYPALALTSKPLAREKLFYSRVALGVKPAKLKALGWDKRTPTWSDIAKAAGAGQLRFAMSSPTSSNTGMSALFAVASAVAGKTEDLAVAEIDGKVLTAFLSGQKLTAGSSGWLADAFVKESAELDAMVNYEAVVLRTNANLPEPERLTLVYPQDGVISADYPLMLLRAERKDAYTKVVAAIKSPAAQQTLARDAYLRPTVPGVTLPPGLSAATVVELSFPNRLDVIDAVLASYQGEWRRPATSIFVLDVSYSMRGDRLEAMRESIKTLAGAEATAASARYMRFQSRERVILVAFSTGVHPAVSVDFAPTTLNESRAKVVSYANALQVDGGTSIYDAMLHAQTLAKQEQARDGSRFVSIVLLTDGANTSGATLAEFQAKMTGGSPARVFPILFGEADNAEMAALAKMTGGRVFDGRKNALSLVFKEIRGYQ